jgi:hypothetical protein
MNEEVSQPVAAATPDGMVQIDADELLRILLRKVEELMERVDAVERVALGLRDHVAASEVKNDETVRAAFTDADRRINALEGEMEVARSLKTQLEEIAPTIREVALKVRALFDGEAPLRRSPKKPPPTVN